VPPPEVVHERLQKVLAEAAFLRRLLRLSVRAKKLAEQEGIEDHAADRALNATS
jgi:hypothetical protein